MLRFFVVPRLARNPNLYFEIGCSNHKKLKKCITKARKDENTKVNRNSIFLVTTATATID